MSTTDCTIRDDAEPIPLMLMDASHPHQHVEQLVDRAHDPRIGGIGVLQLQQRRHLVVDVDAGQIVEYLRQLTTSCWPSFRLAAPCAASPCWLIICRRYSDSEPLNGADGVPMPASGENVRLARVSWSEMKVGRVGSALGVSGEVWNTTSRDGSAISAELTVMRPAKPTLCAPSTRIAPV